MVNLQLDSNADADADANADVDANADAEEHFSVGGGDDSTSRDRGDDTRVTSSQMLPLISNGIEEYTYCKLLNGKKLRQVYVIRFGVMLFATKEFEEARMLETMMRTNIVEPGSARIQCPQCEIMLESNINFAFHSLYRCRPVPENLNEFVMPHVPAFFFVYTKALELLRLFCIAKPSGLVDILDPMSLPYGIHAFESTNKEINYERGLVKGAMEKLDKVPPMPPFDVLQQLLQGKKNWLINGGLKQGRLIFNRPKGLERGVLPDILLLPCLRDIDKLAEVYGFNLT